MTTTTEQIKPSLGFWRSWAMSVGTMIGSGVFMIPAYLAPYGGLGLMAWLPAGLGAIAIALSLAVMARRVPRTGGVYAYAHAGFGDFGGFLSAWVYWISVWASCGAIAVAMVGYLGSLVPFLTSTPLISVFVGLALVWIIVGINLMGIREMGIVQLVTTVLKIVPLVLIGTAGVLSVSPSTFTPLNPTDQPALAILLPLIIVTVWPFVGLEGATIPAGDVIEPEKTIPRALIAGTISTVTIYFIASYGVMGIVPAAQLATSTAPFADAAQLLVGHWGAIFIAVFAVISCFGSLNSNMCIAGQVPMAAAEDQLFPTRFAKRTPRNVPGFALIVAGILTSILLLANYTKGMLGIYLFILQISTITILFSYALAAGAALIMEIHDRSISTGQRLREGMASIVAFGFSAWVMLNAGVEVVYWTFALLLASIPVYVFVTRNKNNNREVK